MGDTPRWPLGGDPDGWPTVSVVMPIRNEAENLERAVEAVLAQPYPKPFDVCLAVGPSDDGTEELAAELAARSPNVTVVENPAGTTPAGLNAAIRATDGEVVVRVDGHAQLCDGYIRRAVTTLARTRAANVGGFQRAVGSTPFERAVAVAMHSVFGTGGARFRVGGGEGPVDTVYLGVFRRDALEAAGGFDERLVRNQDYELNIRLRRAGETVWFDPSLEVTYRPRSTLLALARQYYEYGWWKAAVARMHPGSLRARQVLPVLLTLGVVTGLITSRLSRRARLVPIAYAAGVAAAARLDASRDRGTAAKLLAVYPTMHLAWGIGFVVSIVRRRALPRPGGSLHAGHEVTAREVAPRP